ncbi:MAG: glycine cleavage system protein GcvH [Alphaproteobacteria bacterium]|jgi:glycine cleavage system H protein|nr:glycine cleavage system protein GcvH [Alphaproteobacteria bacterium]MBT5389851.1 glycine cleavage system protein GcvH [Alphaproteobacteria bacterium]MBT5540790.1 glycine cleavage system protein GcvH [Alphaproteobacteria bacterium]MBT5653923.1 glycine cleavage system protein GcvH [Alphaproteobacteria bacterium]
MEKFSKQHEWIRLDQGSSDVGTVGITSYAQEQLGDVVFVDFPNTGQTVKRGEEVAVVESVKAASEVYSPVSGEVLVVNAQLEETPEKVNESPLKEGWFIKIKLSDPKELETLMDTSAYEKFVEDLS